MLKLAIIIGSTRPDRVGEAVARWVLEHAQARSDAQFHLIDLREVGLPFLDEPVPPSQGKYMHEHTKRWSAQVEAYDGYVFVTPEYNHGTSAALKNALDTVYKEWNNKAAGMVAYGSMSGTRAVEQLRLNLAELQVATVRAQVGFALDRDFKDHTRFEPRPGHEQELNTMLDQLVAWATALRQVRLGPNDAVNVARTGVPGFHHTTEPGDGRPLARMAKDTDDPGRVNTGTGDQPGNTGGDRFATPNV